MRTAMLGILGGALLAPASAQRAAGPVELAMRYVAAQEAVMERHAGKQEVDGLIAFYAPDYTYYHPQFGAKVTGLDTVRQGIEAHLGETSAARIEIKGALANGAMVALALRESFVDVASGKRQERDRTTVLTIRYDKIVQRVDI